MPGAQRHVLQVHDERQGLAEGVHLRLGLLDDVPAVVSVLLQLFGQTLVQAGRLKGGCVREKVAAGWGDGSLEPIANTGHPRSHGLQLFLSRYPSDVFLVDIF